MSGMNRSKRFVIRSSLVTGSTIATIIGAQSLAVLDQQLITTVVEDSDAEPVLETTEINPTAVTDMAATTVDTATATVMQAAPSIVIFRRSGQTTTSPTNPAVVPSPASVTILPPDPIAVSAPEPIIVQGEAPPPIVVQVEVPVQQSSGGSSGGSSSNSKSKPRSKSS